jgi:hypothetical protein
VKPALFGLLCVWRRVHVLRQHKSKENSLSNRAFLRGAALLGLLPFVHGLMVFSSEDRGGDEK